MGIIKDSRGDTIVEVLVSLAVLTTILVGAYVAANRTQNASQASQERSEATKLIESQIERVKAYVASGGSVPTGAFCMDEANSAVELDENPFGKSLEDDTLPYEVTGPANPCGGLQDRYNLAVRKSSDTYEFLARWDRVGSGRDQINMYYRTY